LATPEGVTRRSLALYYYTGSRLIYNEVPSVGTQYKARPGDSAHIKKEVSRFQREEHMNQWLPPVMVRGLHKLGRGVKKLRKR
jgi:hypothetical protein